MTVEAGCGRRVVNATRGCLNMVRIPKLFAFALLVAVCAFGLSLARPPAARAVIHTIASSPNPVFNPANSTLTVNAQETDGGNGPVKVSVAAGTLTFVSCQTSGPTGCSSAVASGSGTSTVTLSSGTDGDNTFGEPLAITLTFSPPTVSTPTSVAVSGCQGTGCSASLLGNLVVNPANLPPVATQMDILVSVLQANCGDSITVTAKLSTSEGAVPDGTFVVFGSSLGNSATLATTSFGSASMTMVVPLGFQGTLFVTAASGNIFGQAMLEVTCSQAGPAAQLAITVTPASITCGSTSSILVSVRDQFGRPAGDGTNVTLTVDSGSIVPVTPIFGGLATAVYTSTPNRPGVATITAKAGVATGQALVTVNCAGPSPSPAPTTVPATVVPSPIASPTTVPTPAPAITPPSTGDGGLAQEE